MSVVSTLVLTEVYDTVDNIDKEVDREQVVFRLSDPRQVVEKIVRWLENDVVLMWDGGQRELNEALEAGGLPQWLLLVAHNGEVTFNDKFVKGGWVTLDMVAKIEEMFNGCGHNEYVEKRWYVQTYLDLI
jgi:hypothetical protein